MDLKYFISEKKGLIIVLSVILLIAICGCLYFIFRTPKEEPVIENNESVVVEEPIEDNTEDIEEISQDSVVSVLKAYVTNIRDLSLYTGDQLFDNSNSQEVYLWTPIIIYIIKQILKIK